MHEWHGLCMRAHEKKKVRWEGSKAPYKKKKSMCRLQRSRGVHLCAWFAVAHPHHVVGSGFLHCCWLPCFYKTCLLLAFNDRKFTLYKNRREESSSGVTLLLHFAAATPPRITCVQQIRTRSLTKTNRVRRCGSWACCLFLLCGGARGVSANFQRLLWLVYD